MSRILYWIGNSGRINDPTHYSLQSGGIGGEPIPTDEDDLIIDNNSFSYSGQHILFSSEQIELNSLTINPQYRITLLGEAGNSWALTIPDGEVLARNTILIGSHVGGGATFYADETSYDGGGNTGWIFISPPNVITDNPSSVTNKQGIAHGSYILVDNEVLISRRGFCYVVGNNIPTIEDSVVYEQGNYSSGSYSLVITGLEQGTRYNIRAYVVIGGAVYYGNIMAMFTQPDIFNFQVEGREGYSIITWDSTERADYYIVYYATTPGVTKDSFRFTGVASPFVHQDLIPGRTYYYRVSVVTNGVESELSVELSVLIAGGIVPFEYSPKNNLPTEAYIKLLTSQYQIAENYKTWLRHVIKYSDDVTNVLILMHDHFDVDFAVGKQLDILGSIVGIGRTLPFQPTDESDPTLSDEMYRKLIKATVARNHWDGQLKTIEEKWRDIFPETQIIITDNQDMSISLSLSGEISELLQDLIVHDMILPRPQAVQINYSWMVIKKKKFAYDINNIEFGGYNLGAWVQGS